MTDIECEGNRRRNITYRERNRERLRTKRRARYAASRESLGLPYEPLTVILARAKDPIRQSELNQIRQEKYRVKNRDKINEKNRLKWLENPEKSRKIARASYHKNKHKRPSWAKLNPERHKANCRARNKFRWATDSNYRLEKGLRLRTRLALNGKNKSARMLQLLGCSIEFLRTHLEKQFVPGMTWENYGKVWHVDHILPCAEFHLQHSEEQEICFNWSNLQPLFVKDNLSKSDKIL